MGTLHNQSDALQCHARINTFYSDTTWIEGQAEDQLRHVASWEGMHSIAAFPDLHPGRFGPVGAAFLADRIYPQLVGPDIGCGMSLFRLDLPRRKLRVDKACRRFEDLDTAMDDRDAISLLEAHSFPISNTVTIGLGSLGRGNHFLELQEVTRIIDENFETGLRKGDLCLLVHTGSRGHGFGIYRSLNDVWNNGFPCDSPHGRSYLEAHNNAVKWASINRLAVAKRAAEALRTQLTLVVDSVHNSVSSSGDAWLHRKGAAAPSGGLAPLAGSRDDHSYLMSAEPRYDALWSMSHGAGRRYDRSSMHGRIRKVKSEITAQQRNKFGGQVLCTDRNLLIEEAGVAYKSASDVAADLERFNVAQRLAQMTPLITFKTTQEGRKK